MRIYMYYMYAYIYIYVHTYLFILFLFNVNSVYISPVVVKIISLHVVLSASLHGCLKDSVITFI